jgi:Fungal specific transcription factor domain
VKCEQSAFRKLRQGAFLDFYLPQESRDGACHPLEIGEWLKYVPDMASTPAISLAMDALGAARIASSTNDMRLKEYSIQSYSKALTEMQKSVRRISATFGTETLATAMLLGLYETYGYSDDRCFGWTSHVKATASMLQLMPKALKSSPLERYLRLGYSNDRVRHAFV